MDYVIQDMGYRLGTMSKLKAIASAMALALPWPCLLAVASGPVIL